MIDIIQWRVSIGLWNCCQCAAGPTPRGCRSIKTESPNGKKKTRSLVLSLITVLLFVLTLISGYLELKYNPPLRGIIIHCSWSKVHCTDTVTDINWLQSVALKSDTVQSPHLRLLLLLSGDVELNPGPKIGEKPTLPSLTAFLKSLNNWKEFGINLPEITNIMIEEIERNNQTFDQQKEALYAKWIEVYSNHSWRDVTVALNKCGESTLVENIEDELQEYHEVLRGRQVRHILFTGSNCRNLTDAIVPILYIVTEALYAEGLISQGDVNLIKSHHELNETPQLFKSSHLVSHLDQQLNSSRLGIPSGCYLMKVCQVFMNQRYQPLTDITTSLLQQLELSWLESNCPPYEVDDFIKSMKLQYRNQEIIVDMNWKPKVLFSNLTIIKKQDKTQVEEISKYMQTGKVDEVLKLSGIKRAYLTDVLQPKQPMVVVVDGPPGIGKTTLCRKLLNMWSSETHACEYNLVLYCPLRDSKFAKAEDFPDLFLFDSYKVSKVVEYFKKRNGEGLLIIFDGWDELNTQLKQSSLAAQIIHRKQLYQCSVIVTSRSYASSSLLTASSHHFHVIGFSEEEVSKVIINTFQRDPILAKALIKKKKEDEKNDRIFAATELTSEHDLEAITQLINDLEVQRLCYVPLVCCAVIKVYEEKSRKLPTTRTELFESIILDTINKYLQIRPRNDLDPHTTISRLSSLPSQLDKSLQELCQIAYTNLVNARMTFTSYELRQLSLGETFMADNLGLVTSSIEHNNNKYFFIHSSIQEFLAALWIAKYEKEGKDGGEKTEKMFGKHFRDPQFKNCLKFVAGLTGLKHVSYEQYFNKEINLECMRKPRFGLQMDHYSTFYLNCQMRNFVHMESNIFEKLFILFQLIYESCNRNLCQVLAKSIKNQSLCLNNVAFSLYDWSCLKFFLDASGVKWKHLHLGVLNHRVAVNCHGGIQCKVLEVTLLRPIHFCSLPLFCLNSARECYILIEGGHYNLCHMLECLFDCRKLNTLHITVNHAIVSGITQRTEYLEKNIQNSALQEINLEFNGEVGIDIIKSLINGMSRNRTTRSFSLSATSLDDNASFDITCIENLLKNSTIQYLSLNIPDEFLPSSLDIVEVNTPLTGLEMSSKKLMTSILPHITRLCYLILHEPYTPHLIFEFNPTLQTLSLSLDAAESAIELFNILQANTTLQSLRVEMDRVFDNTKLFNSLETMLKQNQTLQSFELISEGSVYNHIPVSFLSFLHAGITSSTSIKELSVPIPLSKQQFENVKDLISRKVTLKKCHIDFRPDESYQHSPHEKKKEIMISLYEELADVIAMMPATCNFRLLGQEIDDLKTQNSIMSLPYKEESTSCIEAPCIAYCYASTNGKCWKLVTDDDMDKKIITEIQKLASEGSPSTDSDSTPIIKAIPNKESNTDPITQFDTPTSVTPDTLHIASSNEVAITEIMPNIMLQETQELNDQECNGQGNNATGENLLENCFEDKDHDNGISINMRTVTTEGQESCQIDLPHPQSKVGDNKSDQANEEVLTEDDLMDIIDALKEGAFTTSDWYSLGLRLKIRNDDLKTIETDYNKVNRCLTECIVKWIKMGKATYTGLAGALEKMGEDAAANHIRTNNISSSPKAKRRRT